MVKEQLRTLLSTGSLADAAAAKDRLHELVERAAQPETWCAGSLGISGERLADGMALPVRCVYTDGTVAAPKGTYKNTSGKLVGYDPPDW